MSAIHVTFETKVGERTVPADSALALAMAVASRHAPAVVEVTVGGNPLSALDLSFFLLLAQSGAAAKAAKILAAY
jgi:hypothetical protein